MEVTPFIRSFIPQSPFALSTSEANMAMQNSSYKVLFLKKCPSFRITPSASLLCFGRRSSSQLFSLFALLNATHYSTYSDSELCSSVKRRSRGPVMAAKKNSEVVFGLGKLHPKPVTTSQIVALFWQQQNYYGVNLTPLHGSAFQGYFSQPVVDAFDPRSLVAPAISHVIDFTSIKEEDLYDIKIPLKFKSSVGARIHGLACWFDVLFNGSTVQRWLSTAPGDPTTHWYQLRCVLSQPLYVMPGQEICGELHLVAHTAQSYTINLTLSAMWGPGAEQVGITASGKLELKEPYYRMSQPQVYPIVPDQQSQSLLQTQDIPILSQEEDASDLIQQPAQQSGSVINSL